MSDYHDVMRAADEADAARRSAATYGGQIEDGDRTGDVALAVLLAAEALCAELRAASILTDYALHNALIQAKFR